MMQSTKNFGLKIFPITFSVNFLIQNKCKKTLKGRVDGRLIGDLETPGTKQQ